MYFSVVYQLFFVAIATSLAACIQSFVMRRIHRRLLQTRNFWDNILVDSLRLPIHVLIWLTGLFFVSQIISNQTDVKIFLGQAPYFGIVFLLAWFLIRFVKRAEGNILAKNKRADKTTAHAVSKIVRGCILITAVLVMLQTLGVSISGVLAFGGIGGIAIGFAAKDLLANFFGGFMLYLDRPFSVGDWIRSPDKEIEGTVEHIGWRLTRIRTFDKRPLYVPNCLFATISIENPSRMRNRRIKETIGVRYDDVGQISPILEEIRTMLKTHPEIDTTQILMVHLDEFGPSSLNFFIYTFTKTTKWAEFHEVKEDVLLKVHRIIAAHGAQVAFPTTTLHIADQPAEKAEKIGMSDKWARPLPATE